MVRTNMQYVNIVVIMLAISGWFTLGVYAAADTDTKEVTHEPSQQAVELHHSLHRPLDQSQVYWYVISTELID
jgi:hypothetical protein